MILRFDHVSVTRSGASPVLRDFSLALLPGEVVALVGRSGAGKSTALKLVNRLLDPTSGSVLVEGQDTRQWDPIRLRRRVGYVFQDVGLFPHLTVEANVAVVPGLEGWAPPRTHQRTAELLDLVGLPPAIYGGRYPRELSGGERQRVGVARALAIDPPILLMDEPFGALDPITRADLRREFQRLQALMRTTVLIVTHDLFEAFALGQRIAVLHDGELVACETPAAIARSRDWRVRSLIDAWPVAPDPESLH